MIRFLLLAIIRVYVLFHKKQFAASRPVEGNSLDFQRAEALWWAYKFFCRPIEEPEPGKGIEEHLRRPLDFSPPEGFVPETALSLAAGGDLLPSQHIRPDSTLHLWDDVEEFFFSADMVYANLESPVSASHVLSFPTDNIITPPAMNNTREAFDLYRRGGQGINVFSTANNHALDMGVEGLLETLDFLDAKQVIHVGTSRSEAEQDNIPVLEKNSIRVAYLSYTYSLNQKVPPKGQEYLANSLRLNRIGVDVSLIKRHIAIAKNEKKADLVVAFLHWGLEFESFPLRHTIDLGHRLLESGIDVIIGNHPHGLQGAECYTHRDAETGLEKQGLILYALGDLVSTVPLRNAPLGALARIRIEKGRAGGAPLTLIRQVELKPVYKYREMRKNRCVDFRVLDLDKLADQTAGGPLPLTKKERREILRLRALSRRVLPPALCAGDATTPGAQNPGGCRSSPCPRSVLSHTNRP
jgi:poly-gamma-glutamate synthesis protein (capsule biosynthesis protein)